MKNNIPFSALEIEPYSASSYLEDLQPSTHVPNDKQNVSSHTQYIQHNRLIDQHDKI